MLFLFGLCLSQFVVCFCLSNCVLLWLLCLTRVVLAVVSYSVSVLFIKGVFCCVFVLVVLCCCLS